MIVLLRERERELGKRQTYDRVSKKKAKKKEIVKRSGSGEPVELMDNVSPLWCLQAGGMHS